MCDCGTQPTHTNNSAERGATFKVEDMSCAHCVGAIRDALQAGMPGVAVSVDLDTHQVVVGGDAATAASIIREAGYEPRQTFPSLDARPR